MTYFLPEELLSTLRTRWPDWMDLHAVVHGRGFYSVSLLDSDYRWYIFRANLSQDGRWSIIPIAGFDEPVRGTLDWGKPN